MYKVQTTVSLCNLSVFKPHENMHFFICSWAPSKMLHVQLNSTCTCNSEIGNHELVLTLYKYACSKDHNLLPSLCWGVEGWLWNRRYRSVSSFPLYILMESANRSTGADPRRPVGGPINEYNISF